MKRSPLIQTTRSVGVYSLGPWLGASTRYPRSGTNALRSVLLCQSRLAGGWKYRGVVRGTD